jgi:hypothetical protein
LEENLTLEEYIRKNMNRFLCSRKKVHEIYEILREEGIFAISYSWFSRLFAREKIKYLKAENSEAKEEIRKGEEEKEKLFTTEKRLSQKERKDNSEEENVRNFHVTTEPGAPKESMIPEKYKLKLRAVLEVPISEIQEALDAGAKLEDELGSYTGVIFASGKKDARCFEKWLPQDICERYELRYREKKDMANKAEVIRLLTNGEINAPKIKEE